MEFKPPNAEEVRKTFLEKVQDPNFFFLISFLFLYLDIAVFRITGKNLLDFKSSEIENSIPIGKVLVAIAPYFLILYLAPTVRFRLQCACFALRLDSIFRAFFRIFGWFFPQWGWDSAKMRDLYLDARFVSLDDVRQYALRHNEQILYQFALSLEEQNNSIWKMEAICFAFGILALSEVYFSGLLLNTLIFQNFPNMFGPNAVMPIWIILLFFCLGRIICTLAPPTPYVTFVWLPDHPLSEEKKQRLLAVEEEKRKRSEFGKKG